MLLVVIPPAYNDEHPADNAIAAKMIGVAVASASCGGGETTFLAMTHFYGPFSLAGWGSGSGAAGLLGAGVYAVATTGLGLSSRGTLFASAFLPFIMVGTFFLVLPRGMLKKGNIKTELTGGLNGTRNVDEDAALMGDVIENRNEEGQAEDEEEGEGQERDSLLDASTMSAIHPQQPTERRQVQPRSLRANLRQVRHLFIP